MVLHEGETSRRGLYSFPALPLRRQRPCGAKNWTWARQLLGYGRLGDPELVAPISALYREVWAPWQNFFLPCLKLKEKWRQGSHWRKRYEFPRTAYHRLCTPGMLALKERRALRDRYESLDPFALKDELENRLKQILKPKSSGVNLM